ncbi:TetR/AcrR family transcriptional regulator [Bdellovibrio sp. NC01]|uniref:TetR/AcrR family transcriptional regulator n=1 Tax=Bdellovibrio sp. NC01 TaxID=2220073 RepID=UPI00143CCC6F|nr:TetR/AcrR family transcriptional regulator [Bdellovibrio sp. NC01]
MDTKTQAIKSAKAQLQLKGFNGFSFQDIADDLGIRKASLHYYFSSKEDLGLALISDYEDAFLQWTLSLGEVKALTKLERFFDMFQDMSSDKMKVCPTGVFCIDYNTLGTKMKTALLELHKGQKEWIEQVLRECVSDGDLRKGLKIPEVANLILSMVQGSLQIARLTGSQQLVKNNYHSLLMMCRNR